MKKEELCGEEGKRDEDGRAKGGREWGQKAISNNQIMENMQKDERK